MKDIGKYKYSELIKPDFEARTNIIGYKPYEDIHRFMINQIMYSMALGSSSSPSIAVIGSGGGGELLALSQKMPQAKIDVFEKSKEVIKFTKEKIPNQNISYISKVGALKKLRQYDVVFAIEVFEHLTDKEIDNVFEFIKGRIWAFSSTPHKSQNDNELGHINIKSQSTWKSIFMSKGFRQAPIGLGITNWAMAFYGVTV